MSSLYRETINDKTFLVGEFNAYSCKNINTLCDALRETFRWSGFEYDIDAMYLFSWVKEENFKIVVNKFHAIKNEKQKEMIREELESYKNHWNELRYKEKVDKYYFIVEYR